MKALQALSRGIDFLNEWVGRGVSWVTLGLVLVVFIDVLMRYIFNTSFVFTQELEWHLFAFIFLIGAGYTLLHDGHVRIDLVYGAVNVRGRAWINLFGVLFLLMPVLMVVWWTAFPYVMLSWERLETSREAGELPGLFLLKTAMLGFIILLGLQGIALAIRCVLVLAGEEEWDPSRRKQEPEV